MSNNKQSSSVEYLSTQILDNWNDIQAGARNIDEFIEQAKVMQKKQCVDFALKCMLNGLEPHQSTREVVERLFDEGLQ